MCCLVVQLQHSPEFFLRQDTTECSITTFSNGTFLYLADSLHSSRLTSMTTTGTVVGAEVFSKSAAPLFPLAALHHLLRGCAMNFFRILFFGFVVFASRDGLFRSTRQLNFNTNRVRTNSTKQNKQHPSISTKTNVGINIPQLNCNNNMSRHS